MDDFASLSAPLLSPPCFLRLFVDEISPVLSPLLIGTMGHAKKLLLCLLIIIVQYYSNAFLLINKKTHDRSALAPLKGKLFYLSTPPSFPLLINLVHTYSSPDILGAKGGATISKDKVLKAKVSWGVIAFFVLLCP